MSHPSWNDRYASEEPLPWDTGTPDPMLVEFVESHAVAPGRALEVGCGTGTNAIYLVQHGFEIVGVDVSPLAIDKARDKARGRCRFETVDFLSEAPSGGPVPIRVRPRLLSHVQRRSRASAVRAERSCRARRRRHMAEPGRQHRGSTARCRPSATKCARGHQRDRAVVGDPAVSLR